MPGTVPDKGGKKKTGKDPCPYVDYTLVGKKIIDTYVKYSTSVPGWLRLVRSDFDYDLRGPEMFPCSQVPAQQGVFLSYFSPHLCSLSLSNI